MSQEEVQTKLTALTEAHAKWAAAKTPELRADLQSSLKAVELDLEDLEDSVSIAKGDRSQDPAEVEAREKYVISARQQLATIADALSGREEGADAAAEEAAAGAGAAPAPSVSAPAQGAAAVPDAKAAAPPAAATPQPQDDSVPMCRVPTSCLVM